MSEQPSAHPPDMDRHGDLIRRFEPVVRFTAGELFFPMSVGAYVERAALWERTPGVRTPHRLVDHGELDIDKLCRAATYGLAGGRPDGALELRYVPRPLGRTESKQWRRDPSRPRFRSTTRFAAVGLLGRVLDSLFRLSLVLRGAVPGGLTAALHRTYAQSPAASEFPYYAHVSEHAGYVVIQYWFFYAMNDWRSTFGGVNDHEADWEQVSVFLVRDESTADTHSADTHGADTDSADTRGADRDSADTHSADNTHSADGLRVAWVAFSSHDEVGDDLRRRADDPDIEWVNGTHAVVYAGAGSHSGAYLPGEYLVRVEPPALRPVMHGLARVRGIIFPWTRDRPRTGLGIPFIDYKRGDGTSIGQGGDHPWTPVLVDDRTPWVRDFQGLWGLDTTDPFGGERAPAGPRYERNGTIRPSWSDPVGWAGLDKVPATKELLAAATAARAQHLADEIVRLTTDIDACESDLQALSVGTTALPPAVAGGRRGGIGATTRLREQERAAEALRVRRRAAVIEREHLERQAQNPPRTPPHAHLRHRTLPDVSPARPPGLLLRFWTEISLSVLLALLGLAVLFDYSSLWSATITAILIVTTVEAVLRRQLPVFILGLAVITAIVVLIIILFTNLRVGVGILAVLAAVVILVANIRANVGRR